VRPAPCFALERLEIRPKADPCGRHRLLHCRGSSARA
jgi:hypothetical protein